MVGLSRRNIVGIGVTASIVSLAALTGGNAMAAAGGHPAGGRVAREFAGVRPKIGPPVGRAKPGQVGAEPRSCASVALDRADALRPPSIPARCCWPVTARCWSTPSLRLGGTSAWYKLTPSSTGSYVDGTWSKIASMPTGDDPLYFASAILPDGRMIVEGGEYLGGTPVWTNKGAIYNPVSNKWQSVTPPGGWTNIGDAQSRRAR